MVGLRKSVTVAASGILEGKVPFAMLRQRISVLAPSPLATLEAPPVALRPCFSANLPRLGFAVTAAQPPQGRIVVADMAALDGGFQPGLTSVTISTGGGGPSAGKSVDQSKECTSGLRFAIALRKRRI